MRRTAVLLVGLLAAAGLAGCSSGPSYAVTVKQCQAALVTQYKAGGKGKPSDCDGVTDDDYEALVLNAAIGNLGWTDSSGDFDKNKMLDSVTETP